MAKRKHEAGHPYHPLHPEGLAKTGAILGFIGWLVGLVWHGGMGQPSMMVALYNVPYMNMMAQGSLLAVFIVGGFVGGWLTAKIYNWTIGAFS